MSTDRILILLLAIPLILLAIWLDRRRWSRKPREQLVAMLTSDNWRYWKPALKELRRRGDDTSIYQPRLLSRLLAESRLEREAARITVADHYPELRASLADYRSADAVDSSRAKLKPLLERFAVE